MMRIEKNQIKPKNNIVVTQAWVSKDLQRLPTKFHSFKVILKYLKLYSQYCSLNTLKYLVDSRRSWFERAVWVIINCVIVSGLIYMIYVSYEDYVTSPILTSTDSDSFPTTELEFPGIAICSVNRISKQSAMKMASDIFDSKVTNLPMDELLILISQFGNLYPSDFRIDQDRNIELDQLLTTYYKGTYDIMEIMKSLSPQCSIMLESCKLYGSTRNCSEIFDFRKTQDGYCCTFNYMRENDDIPELTKFNINSNKSPRKVLDLGIERGLTVVMNPLLDDYLYPILPITGWKVIVFNPQDYPDVASGGVTQVLAIPNTETYIDVTGTSFFSTKIIEGFPKSKRNCVFPEEMRIKYGNSVYTYSDCIVDCKVDDIQKVCGCRPFYYPRRGKKEYSWRVCTTSDTVCLGKHKMKWSAVFPNKNNNENINRNQSLRCEECYPACNDTGYSVLSTKSYMLPGLFKTNLLWNITITDQAILHVFFSKFGSIRLKQDVSSYWYELLSNIGGICGIFIGCSVISIAEILYFIMLTLRELLYNESAIDDDDDDDDDDDRANNKIQSDPRENIQTIYWSELIPRSWQSTKHGQFPKNRAKN